jgi:hypothetical protein
MYVRSRFVPHDNPTHSSIPSPPACAVYSDLAGAKSHHAGHVPREPQASHVLPAQARHLTRSNHRHDHGCEAPEVHQSPTSRTGTHVPTSRTSCTSHCDIQVIRWRGSVWVRYCAALPVAVTCRLLVFSCHPLANACSLSPRDVTAHFTSYSVFTSAAQGSLQLVAAAMLYFTCQSLLVSLCV